MESPPGPSRWGPGNEAPQPAQQCLALKVGLSGFRVFRRGSVNPSSLGDGRGLGQSSNFPMVMSAGERFCKTLRPRRGRSKIAQGGSPGLESPFMHAPCRGAAKKSGFVSGSVFPESAARPIDPASAVTRSHRLLAGGRSRRTAGAQRVKRRMESATPV